MEKNKKLLVRKILLIAWLAVCTAIFITFFGLYIYSICDIVSEIDYFSSSEYQGGAATEMITHFKQSIALVVFYIIMIAGLYASVVVLLIPKIKTAFRPLSVENGENVPGQ